MTRKQSKKPFAESLPFGEDIDALAVVAELLIELHAHEKAAMSEAQKVRRTARRIERLVKTSAYALSPASGDSNHGENDGDSHAQREGNRAIERTNLLRFAKLL